MQTVSLLSQISFIQKIDELNTFKVTPNYLVATEPQMTLNNVGKGVCFDLGQL